MRILACSRKLGANRSTLFANERRRLITESPDFISFRSVYCGCVTYGTIMPDCGLVLPTAQIHLSCNRCSTNQRIAKWGVFIGLCESSKEIHSHLASCYSQIFSDLTVAPVLVQPQNAMRWVAPLK